jgi:hypothetical protein
MPGCMSSNATLEDECVHPWLLPFWSPISQLSRMLTREERQWWAVVVFGVWGVTAVSYFLMAIGEQGRAYLGTWVQVSFWAAFWSTKVVAFESHWYQAHELAPWLLQEIYHQPLLAWLFEAGIWGLLPALAVLGVLVVFTSWPTTPLWIGWHRVAGAQLFPVRRLQRRLQGRRLHWRRKTQDGLVVAGVALSQAVEQHHVLLCGAPGVGKTTILRSVLRQIAARGETAIVVDWQRTLIGDCYEPERGDVLLNPLDARCPTWSPWGEIASASDAEAMARALLPVPPAGSSVSFR